MDPEQENKRQRRSGWDTGVAPVPDNPSSAPSGGMLGSEIRAQIAAKIAASLGTGGSGTIDPAYAMSCRIYIGSLFYDLTAADVSAMFESFGQINKCEMQMDPLTGKSKGFCFVEFTKPEMAEAAMAMNGFEIAGRKIKVGRPFGGANGSALPPGTFPNQPNIVTAVPTAVAHIDEESSDIVNPNTSIPSEPALFTLVLENMVSTEEARTNLDLQREVETEASNYGPLRGSMEIVYNDDDTVKIIIHYALAKDAKRSLRAMNGRLFDNRVVKASLC